MRLTRKERDSSGTGIGKEALTRSEKGLTNFGSKVLTKLADYEDLEEQGLMLKLPCKVGDKIFTLHGTDYFVMEIRIAEDICIHVAKDKANSIWTGTDLSVDEFGTLWFRTKEESVQALERVKGGTSNGEI